MLPDKSTLLSLLEQNYSMLQIAKELNLTYPSIRYWFKKFQLQAPIQKPLRFTDEQIAEAVRTSLTWVEMFQQLGARPVGGAYYHIRKRVKQQNLDIRHFRNYNGENAQMSCLRSTITPDEILTISQERVPRKLLLRAMLAKGVPYLCKECGRPPIWQQKPLVLEINHKNEDRCDNRLFNLEFLCPNCHRQHGKPTVPLPVIPFSYEI